MPNNAVLIISHERADNIATLSVLKQVSCSLPVYIIVDDQDSQLADYQKLYGDSLRVFSKQAVMETADTLDNFHVLNSALYARLYAQQLAEQLGLDHYVLMDDDITSMNIRYECNGMLKASGIRNIDPIFQDAFDLLDCSPYSAVGFGHEGSFIGGLAGKFSRQFDTSIIQIFAIKTSRPLRFLGTRCEDMNGIVACSRQGHPVIANLNIGFSSPKRGENAGGLSTDYSSTGMYLVGFYEVVNSPDISVVTTDFKVRHRGYCPMVLSEDCKK